MFPVASRLKADSQAWLPSMCCRHFLPLTACPGMEDTCACYTLSYFMLCSCDASVLSLQYFLSLWLNSSFLRTNLEMFPSERCLSWCHCPTSWGSPSWVLWTLCSPPLAYFSGQRWSLPLLFLYYLMSRSHLFVSLSSAPSSELGTSQQNFKPLAQFFFPNTVSPETWWY